MFFFSGLPSLSPKFRVQAFSSKCTELCTVHSLKTNSKSPVLNGGETKSGTSFSKAGLFSGANLTCFFCFRVPGIFMQIKTSMSFPNGFQGPRGTICIPGQAFLSLSKGETEIPNVLVSCPCLKKWEPTTKTQVKLMKIYETCKDSWLFDQPKLQVWEIFA